MRSSPEIPEKAYKLRDLSNLSKSLRAFLRNPLASWAYSLSVTVIIFGLVLYMSGKGLKLLVSKPVLGWSDLALFLLGVRILDSSALDYVNFSRIKLILELKNDKVGSGVIMGLMEEGLMEDIPPSLREEELEPLKKRHFNNFLKKLLVGSILTFLGITLLYL